MGIKFGDFSFTGNSRRDSDNAEYINDNDKRWRFCLCCHVRTGTIFLGIWHLALHVLSLAAIAVMVLHPPAVDPKLDGDLIMINGDDHLAILPTPLSTEVQEEPHALPLSPATESVNPTPNPDTSDSSQIFYASFVYKDWLADRADPKHSHNANQDLNIEIGVTFCTLAITLLMIYGAIRGKSLYLMPFFCLQAFEFFVNSLWVIGYLSSFQPDIREMLDRNRNLPLRDELLAMDPQCMSLLVLTGILLNLVIKVYFISIVWSCYKYLTITAEAASIEWESRSSGIVDNQNLLEVPSMVIVGSDLPDYTTAVSDPRFAKKPIYLVPPPPYAAVVALPPEMATDVAATNSTSDVSARNESHSDEVAENHKP